MPQTAQEEVRQVAARFLVESLGYPKAELVANVPLTHDHQEPFVAALMVTKGESSPFIVVEVAPPGATPPQSVPSAVTESGAQYYFWFDGFWDDPRRGPVSRGAYYFERRDAGFAQVPMLPHHHRPAKQRHRRRPTNHRCPSCGRRLELFCAIPCNDRCRRWGCYWYSLIYCPSCQQRWARPKAQKQVK